MAYSKSKIKNLTQVNTTAPKNALLCIARRGVYNRMYLFTGCLKYWLILEPSGF